MTEPAVFFDKKDLRLVIRAFKALDEQAQEEGRKIGYELAQYAAQEVRKTALTRTVNPVAVRRIADGVVVSRTSKIGELTYGFARQRFSGGGSTRTLWAGFEFGSSRYRQFPTRTPRAPGRGNLGYFIHPTLRRIQPELVRQWLEAMDRVVKKWV